MSRVVGWLAVVVMTGVAVAGALVARGAAHGQLYAGTASPDGVHGRGRSQRDILFDELRPVKLLNCELARFGEPNDGGYLVCANLLKDVDAAYSYGISGYDGWGCQVSTTLRVPVHQYDCFNTTAPLCPTGQALFHAECIAGSARSDADGRQFDSLSSQIVKNGDTGKHLIVKMDVEGAEWQSILETPDEVLDQVDQFIFEFHGVNRDPELYLKVLAKLKRLFEVAHLHFNNYACVGSAPPFPAWAYEVTLVSKRLAKVDPAGQVLLPNALDAPNTPLGRDCQSLGILQ